MQKQDDIAIEEYDAIISEIGHVALKVAVDHIYKVLPKQYQTKKTIVCVMLNMVASALHYGSPLKDLEKDILQFCDN